MTWCRVGSRPETAARTATVFPAPTFPVTTPSACSTMQKLIRAIASAWAWRANRSLAAICLPNGVRASPKCAAHGARLAITAVPGLRELHLQPGEVDLHPGAGFLVVGGGDHAQVVDPGWVLLRRRGGLDGFVHVMADHERDRGPGRLAVQEQLDPGQIFRVIPQLDAPADEGGIDGVGVAFQRDGRGAGYPAGHRPAERFPQDGGVCLAVRAAGA